MLDPEKFRRNHSKTGEPLNEWVTSIEDEVEIVVRGDDQGVDRRRLSEATEACVALPDLKVKAIQLLTSFMRDSGTWELAGLDLGLEAEQFGCSLLVSLHFTSDGDPWEYGYTYFKVGFVLSANRSGSAPYWHPLKFVVGFH